MLYPQGTFVDDILVHKFSDNDYLLVINAGTREKDYQWIRSQVGAFAGVHISDYSDYYTQLAIQGPRAQETLAKLTKSDLARDQESIGSPGAPFAAFPTCSSRAPATPGEDGFEIYMPSDEPTSARVWEEVLEAGKEFGMLPCGLGARNTLRLEAAMALYGHEISEEINVFEAGLERFCKIGQERLSGFARHSEAHAEGGPKRKLVGLEMVDRGIARDGYKVCSLEGAADRLRHQRLSSPLFLKRTLHWLMCRWISSHRGRKWQWRCAGTAWSKPKWCPLRFTAVRKTSKP